MIDKTAIINKSAEIHSSVKIGPYSVIGPKVKIGENTEIQSHVNITGNTKIGKGNKIYPFVSINDPQDLKYDGEETSLVIGDNNKIREKYGWFHYYFNYIYPGSSNTLRLVIMGISFIVILLLNEVF